MLILCFLTFSCFIIYFPSFQNDVMAGLTEANPQFFLVKFNTIDKKQIKPHHHEASLQDDPYINILCTPPYPTTSLGRDVSFYGARATSQSRATHTATSKRTK